MTGEHGRRCLPVLIPAPDDRVVPVARTRDQRRAVWRERSAHERFSVAFEPSDAAPALGVPYARRIEAEGGEQVTVGAPGDRDDRVGVLRQLQSPTASGRRLAGLLPGY